MNTTDPMPQNSFSRRDFVKAASLAGTAITSGLGLSPASAGAEQETAGVPAGSSAGAKPLIGFQAEVPYLMQFGIERFLDDVQTRAGVNALFLHGNLYNASWNGLDKSSAQQGTLRRPIRNTTATPACSPGVWAGGISIFRGPCTRSLRPARSGG